MPSLYKPLVKWKRKDWERGNCKFPYAFLPALSQGLPLSLLRLLRTVIQRIPLPSFLPPTLFRGIAKEEVGEEGPEMRLNAILKFPYTVLQIALSLSKGFPLPLAVYYNNVRILLLSFLPPTLL